MPLTVYKPGRSHRDIIGWFANTSFWVTGSLWNWTVPNLQCQFNNVPIAKLTILGGEILAAFTTLWPLLLKNFFGFFLFFLATNFGDSCWPNIRMQVFGTSLLASSRKTQSSFHLFIQSVMHVCAFEPLNWGSALACVCVCLCACICQDQRCVSVWTISASTSVWAALPHTGASAGKALP